MIASHQVYQPHDGGQPIIVINEPGHYIGYDGQPVIDKARVFDYHTGKNPRWISPQELAAGYQLIEEDQ